MSDLNLFQVVTVGHVQYRFFLLTCATDVDHRDVKKILNQLNVCLLGANHAY